jgi:hypothetical protein
MTPGIAENRLQKGVVVRSGGFGEAEAGDRPDKFVVRIPRSQKTVSLRVNTRLMAEQREIERTNEAIRRAGR